ncbi:MAG: ATP-binding cassette domain-containing protein [Ilumatobacteraceae bacterium]
MTAEPPVTPSSPLVAVDHLDIRFPVGRAGFWGRQTKFVHAVDDVSFAIAPGETLGLVGESGSGKSTIGRAVLRRLTPAAGTISFQGQDITNVSGEPLRQLRRQMQMVFQDPYASLNPRMTVLELVAEPLLVHGMISRIDEGRDQVASLLQRCGLPIDAIDRHPHAFSGGQRQRIGIARALALRPEFIVADEPVSALDVSVEPRWSTCSRILQGELRLTYLFIAHDLSVVRHISHRIAILCGQARRGRPGRRRVRRAAPSVHRGAALVGSDSRSVGATQPTAPGAARRDPQPHRPTAGCRFASRCPIARDNCREEQPPLLEKEPGHFVACLYR